MARQHGPVCRLCRREGMKLFLKGTRCDTPKCAFERRDSPPGMNVARRGKLTDYGLHLREKQKVKNHYGLLERQFRKLFAMAEKGKGNTGERLMSLLERRLDNIVYRLGFGRSRAQSRLLITHGHITVNGRRVSIPSFLVRPGDAIQVKSRPKSYAVGRGEPGRSAARRARFPQPRGRPAAGRACASHARNRRYVHPCPAPPDRGAMFQVAAC